MLLPCRLYIHKYIESLRSYSQRADKNIQSWIRSLSAISPCGLIAFATNEPGVELWERSPLRPSRSSWRRSECLSSKRLSLSLSLPSSTLISSTAISADAALLRTLRSPAFVDKLARDTARRARKAERKGRDSRGRDRAEKWRRG